MYANASIEFELVNSTTYMYFVLSCATSCGWYYVLVELLRWLTHWLFWLAWRNDWQQNQEAHVHYCLTCLRFPFHLSTFYSTVGNSYSACTYLSSRLRMTIFVHAFWMGHLFIKIYLHFMRNCERYKSYSIHELSVNRICTLHISSSTRTTTTTTVVAATIAKFTLFSLWILY